MFRRELVSSCDQPTRQPQKPKNLYWLQSLGPNLQGEFLLLGVQAFPWHRGCCLRSCAVKDMVHPVTKCPSGTDLWLWHSEEKHSQVCWGSDLTPTFSLICPRQEPAPGSSSGSSPWQLRLCHREVAAEDPSFSLRHMETMCTYFCSGGCALGSCLAVAERAGFLSSHITELAVLPWAWGVAAPPSSPCSLWAACGLFSPWNLPAFESQTIDNLEWLFPAQWGLGQGLPSALGSHAPPFPASPRAHTKESRFCCLLLPLFVYLQGKQRKCLLMPGKTNHFKMKGLYC